MTTYRKFQVILSGASGIEYQEVATVKEAYYWIKNNLTDVQQACVVVKPILKRVPDATISRPN